MSWRDADRIATWIVCCLTALALAAPPWSPPAGTVLRRLESALVAELFEHPGSVVQAAAGRGPCAAVPAELTGRRDR
ncbi:hypothetical protein [Streptomyces anulatus]|uniref:hypothetical protein n=1 Tax=Streptomyces anulatus TaxID=1892 RepID=UPI00386B2092|nr:hypothetical protein OG536_00245 [Streptomyces anulatus]